MRLLILLLIIPGFLAGSPFSMKYWKARTLNKLEDRLVAGLNKYMVTGVYTEDLKSTFLEAQSPFAFRNMETTKANPIMCVLCRVVTRVVLAYRENGATVEDLSRTVKTLCTKSKLETENVCNGTIDLNIGIFLYIIDNKKPELTPATICGVIGQPLGCPPPDESNWDIEIPAKIPFTLRKPIAKQEKPLNVLHITDIHYDDLYEVGANANCGEPLCCGSNQGAPKPGEEGAGTWGDYRTCDMPWYTVENLMKQVMTHDIDYFYYTGDIINHRVWATSIKKNIETIKKTYGQFRETFANIPVFPILGNHEPNPLNEFSPDNVTEYDLSTQWLYDTVAEEWSHWLPESTQETIKKGGYYTVLVRPGFRIVALNSNVAYTFNWWLMYDQSMLKSQLEWLVETLFEAEKSGEIVHILSHVPTGDTTCFVKWSQEYQKIVDRFSHVISAQFVGHTHYDELNLYFKDQDINQPISVVFNGGSFTTYTNLNPNYVLYDVNPVTYQVEDYHEWIYNLTEANKHSTEIEPEWFKLYSFKEAYGLKTMDLPELVKLVQRMATNQTLLDQYYRFKMRDGDVAMQLGCNQNCHEKNLCNIVSSVFGHKQICTELVYKFRESNKQSKFTYLWNKFKHVL